MADIVAKVFLGWRTKIPRAADVFYARRGEGPYRFIQNLSRTFVTALKGDAAAEKSKDQLWRDFLGCSIFDFCNNIGTKRTWQSCRSMSAMGKSGLAPDVAGSPLMTPTATSAVPIECASLNRARPAPLEGEARRIATADKVCIPARRGDF